MHTKYLTVALAFFLFVACGQQAGLAQHAPTWAGSWRSAQQAACLRDQLPRQTFSGATLRETVHLSIGGSQLRLRLSNLFGQQELALRSVTVARATAGIPGTIEKGSSITVRFHGATKVTLPAGTESASDAIPLPMQTLSSLTVTMEIDHAPDCATTHGGARATSFLQPGSHANDETIGEAERFAHWYFLSAVDVEADTPQRNIVAFGDSITDGRGATDDANNRWTDVLAQRLAPRGIGVLNLGIGGNCVLHECLGQSGVQRFERDALNAPETETIILFEGINDIGGLDRVAEHTQAEHDALVESLEHAFTQMAAKAHAHGRRIIGGTLTPFLGSDYYHPSERTEQDRLKLNTWIRARSAFDGVIDFDSILSDPLHPGHLSPEVDSGDHLHPSPEGYRRMGEGVSINLLIHDNKTRLQSGEHL
jgi:lysophospholipase L1-like esterase